jgi:hypothetical protein
VDEGLGGVADPEGGPGGEAGLVGVVERVELLQDDRGALVEAVLDLRREVLAVHADEAAEEQRRVREGGVEGFRGVPAVGRGGGGVAPLPGRVLQGLLGEGAAGEDALLLARQPALRHREGGVGAVGAVDAVLGLEARAGRRHALTP